MYIDSHGGITIENDGQSRDDYFYILSTQGGKLEWSTRPLIGDFEGLGIIGHSGKLVLSSSQISNIYLKLRRIAYTNSSNHVLCQWTIIFFY